MSQYKFKINGKEFEVAVNSIENNIASVNVNGVDYSVELDSTPETHATLAINAGGAAPSNTPAAPGLPTSPATAGSVPASAVRPEGRNEAGAGKKIVSPLPGVIIDVCVNVGDSVKRGQKIAVIEAMKMENDILAEADGTVTAIYVKKTDSVLEGADIASIA
ncbi:MAG: acetyl-CoA carboxylase biotin carboxyl carrier protein subunit [Bacteroidales bacterium]|nr:acetyl-CoA carboxylase biotin carboxyl carrier protein subunit [Bacteroidales bacterium]